MDFEKLIQSRSSFCREVASTLWGYAETAFKEYRSCQYLCEILEKEGFHITKSPAGVETAFIAEYGQGSPVVALLAEYDALPKLSQQVSVTHKPLKEGGSGHGCGHNMLGTASLAAALAVKDAIVSGEAQGTVRLYGTPAEELLLGKVMLVKGGVFDGVDVALGWHPERYNALLESTFTAVNAVKFHYHGRTAHAAIDPYNGRSALDAVELLNVSANYLREHVPKTVSLHYSTLCDGLAPNVVPENATAWYFVRGANRREVDSVYQRLRRCAFAAAEMTDTTCTEEFLGGCSDYMPNRTLEGVLWNQMKESSLPTYTEEEKSFIAQISQGMEDAIQGGWDTVQEEFGRDVTGDLICDFWCPPSAIRRGKVIAGSMDIGDVSHILPTAQFSIACYGYGVVGHSWRITAYAGSSVGYKGMLKAAEIMAKATVALFHSPETVAKAKEEFRAASKTPYVSPLPDGFRYDSDMA